MKKFLLTLAALVAICASADTPPPGTVKAKLLSGDDGTAIGHVVDSLKVNVTNSVSSSPNVNVHDGAGTSITSTLVTGKQGLDVNVVNASSSTVTQGPGGLSPWLVHFDNSTIGVTGSLGRTWSLLNTTDSVNVGNFPVTFGVTQSTSPWVTSRNWALTFAGDKVDASGSSVAVSNFPATQPVSGTVSVSNAFNLEATQLAFKSANHTDLLGINTTLGSPFQAGGSIGNTSFGISGTLPAYAATPTFNVGTTGGLALDSTLSAFSAKFNSLGQKTMANSAPVVIASDQSAIPVTGTFFQATQPVSGTVISNIGTTGGLALDSTVSNVQGSSSGGAAGSKSSLSGGIFNTVAPTLTNGQQASLQFDVNGNLKITPAGGSSSVTQGTSPWVDNISQFGGNNVVTGTGASGVGIPRVTVSNDSNILSTQSGAWNVGINAGSNTIGKVDQGLGGASAWKVDGSAVTQPVSAASLPLPALAATSTKQSDGTQKTQVVDGAGVVVGTNYGSAVNAHRVAAQIGNASAVADFNAGVTGAQTLRTTSNVTRNGTELDYNFGAVGANTLRGASQIGNATGAADFNAGATTAQTVRTASNSYDGSGNALTSSTFNAKTGQSSIASGQDIQTVTGTGSALNGDAIASTDVAAYRDISLQIVVTGTNTTTFQGSNDNFTNTFSVNCQTVASGAVAPVQTTAATILVHCPVKYRYFRARVTAFTSGTSAGTLILSPLASTTDLGARQTAGTTTVTGTVNTNPATFTFSTQVASAARTVTGNSGNITQAAPNNQVVFELNVTAVSGTAPTLDLVFQESPDNGTTWVDEWHWQRVTAAGQFYTPNLTLNTSHFRFVWTIGGTTPSFTFSVGSNQGNQVGQIQRRFFDRTISLTTANSTTASWLTDGCLSFNITLNDSACVTFPTLTIQSSEDNVNWASTLGVLASTANGTFVSTTTQQPAHFSRVITSTAGTVCTLGYVALRCTQH